MTRRLIYLGVLVALLVGGDVAARGFVEATVNSRAQQEAPNGSSVSASIGGFPFVPPLLLSGDISHVSVHIENIEAGKLVFAEVDLDLDGVHLDRGRLLNNRKARITGIDRGKLTAIVNEQGLSDALGRPARMVGGRITVTVEGQDVPLTPTVTASGQLVLTGSLGSAFVLGVPKNAYVPCVSAVVVEDARMKLTCDIDEVPPALRDAAEEIGV
jgi:hypothetical protein